jgi:mycothiol synthase
VTAIRIAERLDSPDTAEVLAVIASITEADGVAPLSEHVLLHLRHGGDEGGRHFIAVDAKGAIVGYAHLDSTDEVHGASAELAVHPDHRRCGIARRLVEALIAATADGRLRLWAHGEQAAGAALAQSFGFTHSRVLWQMRRSLLAPLPEVALPDGISLRTFNPGDDDAPWLALNGLAFAGHPEQGEWTNVDLHQRLSEPWFSPSGFLLASDEATGNLIGFHWTKVHGRHGSHGHEAIGEVYVVGVDPAWGGQGLGRALTLAGLQHLRSLGLGQAMLYVDSTNTAAIHLYESLGFTRWDTDVMYLLTPHT